MNPWPRFTASGNTLGLKNVHTSVPRCSSSYKRFDGCVRNRVGLLVRVLIARTVVRWKKPMRVFMYYGFPGQGVSSSDARTGAISLRPLSLDRHPIGLARGCEAFLSPRLLRLPTPRHSRDSISFYRTDRALQATGSCCSSSLHVFLHPGHHCQ